MIDIPVSAPDDEILYEQYRIRNADRLRDVWIAVFRQVHSRGELFHVLFHPERLCLIHESFRGLIDHIQEYSATVWFPTLNQLADWWKRRSSWSWEPVDNDLVKIEAPPASTILVKDCPSRSGQARSGYVYKSYRALPPASLYPAFTIGLSRRCPPSISQFLHDEGFLAIQNEKASQHSLFLDHSDFNETAARALLDEIDNCEKPLLRLWRWPNGLQSAFCLSADICAIDLRDFIDRTMNFCSKLSKHCQRAGKMV